MASKQTKAAPRLCTGCNQYFASQGFTMHQRACLPQVERRQQDLEIEKALQTQSEEPAYVMPKLKSTRGGRSMAVEVPAGPIPAGDTAGEWAETNQAQVQAFEMPKLKSTQAQKKLKSSRNLDEPPKTVANPLPAAEGTFKMPKLKSTLKKGHASTLPDSKSSTQPPNPAPGTHVPTNYTTRSQMSGPTVPQPRVPSESYPLPQEDDIRTIYHPDSGRPTVIKSFSDYGQEAIPPPPSSSYHPQPWLPFHSKTEFAFAEIILKAAMPHSAVDALIKVVHQLIRDRENEPFVIKNSEDLEKIWNELSEPVVSEFKHQVIEVPYKKSVKKFDFWSRSLSDYCRSVIEDPYLGSLCELDAVKLAKFDGKKWLNFIHEPWTAGSMWAIQDQLNGKGKPLLITLYIDKTRLSSFGTAQGHPIVAQISNLPHDVRNGKGLGAAQVVGWLPIVEEEESEKGKPGYTNFKKAVYHACVKAFLSSIADHSYEGIAMLLAGKIPLSFYPLIYILASDYEEQVIMTLIRGALGKYPCPICLVPKDQQMDFTVMFPPRTAKESRRVYEKAKTLKAAEKEELLKSVGLRDVENAFWSVNFGDPHAATTFDNLHANDGGTGGRHLWPLAKRHIHSLGRSMRQCVDDQIAALPPWRGLTHFTQIMSVHFSDGNKFRDIMKMLIFVSHNVLTEENDPCGYLLLRAVRAYLDMTMFENLELHTTETLALLEQAILRFGKVIKEYSDTLRDNSEVLPDLDDDWQSEPEDDCDDDASDISNEDSADEGMRTNTPKKSGKDFNFPKNHAHTHVVQGIKAKGVIGGYSTRLFERLHGPLKTSYQRRTNFKNVAPQILKAERHMLAAVTIRDRMDLMGSADISLGDEEQCDIVDAKNTKDFGNVYLGSPQKKCTFRSFNESEHYSKDSAFQRLHICLSNLLNDVFQRPESPVTITQRLSVKPDEKLVEHRFIKASYESTVDWRMRTDYLRCSPNFFGKERFDCVIINNHPEPDTFARLLFVFTYTVSASSPGVQKTPDGRDYIFPVALVQPFQAVQCLSKKDKDLSLYRLQAKPRADSILVPARSIRRGAYIVSEGVEDMSLVVDVVDSDMFLRIRSLYSSRHSA